MNTPDFTPRPVIHLDMSRTNALSSGTDGLKRRINAILNENAKRHGVDLENRISEARFAELIKKVAKKSTNSKCVLLIDEYDSPVVSLTQKDRKFWNEKLIDETRDVMRPFYRTIKSSGACLGFTLLTGVTKFSRMGVFSELNNLVDLSMENEFASLLGFTQAELEKYYAPYIEEFALHRGTDRTGLLKVLRDEYDGFSFDGRTRLYNPYSIYLFMKKGELDNYWMDSGSSTYLRYFLKEKASFLVDLSGFKVGLNFAKHPGEIEKTTAEGFLYQSGYLTLRKDEDGNLSLDYPNGEVRKSMAELSVLAMMNDSVNDVKPLFDELSVCLRSGEPQLFFQHIRSIMANFSYQALFAAADSLNKLAETKAKKTQKRSPGEGVYQKFLLKYFSEMGVVAKREKSGSLGWADLVVSFLEKTYVIELKMAQNNDALAAAQRGLDQIRANNYGGAYKDPILLSLGLDKDLRNTTACVFAIGNMEGRLIVDENGEIRSA
jgi:hypothetical protein